MRFFKLSYLLLLFAFLLGPNNARAIIHWKMFTQGDQNLWEDAKAMVVYNGTLYFSANNLVFISQDGDNFSVENIPDAISSEGEIIFPTVVNFAVHKGKLYAFANDLLEESDPKLNMKYIYEKDNDNSWRPIWQGTPSQLGVWTDAISHGDFIYAGGINGQMWRTSGGGPSSLWERNDMIYSQEKVFFYQFDGELYSAGVNGQQSRINKLTNENQWDDPNSGWTPLFNQTGIETTFTEQFSMGFVEFDNSLYIVGSSLWRLEKGQNIFEPVFSSNNPSQPSFPIPFTLNNRLHVLENDLTTHLLTNNGTWENLGKPVPSCGEGPANFGKSVIFNDKTFLLPCVLMSYEDGIHSVKRVGHQSVQLIPNQTMAPLLSWTVTVNENEQINKLVVYNAKPFVGTYEDVIAGRDITNLYLKRLSDNLLIKLDNVSPSSWELPPDKEISISDGDTFLILGDIGPHPIEGVRVQFALLKGKIEWNTNTDFPNSGNPEFPDIMAAQEQFISFPPPAPAAEIPRIEKVIVAPIPARDNVRFLYTLDTTSDVTIQIYDVQGTLIKEIKDLGKAPHNQAETTWNASNAAPGLYFARIKIQSHTSSLRILKERIVIER